MKIGENRCTVVQNAPSACPPVRPQSGLPPVRPSARAGAGRTCIHKTPDRPQWAAVTRSYWQLIAAVHFGGHVCGKRHLNCTCFVLLAPRWNLRRTDLLKFAVPSRTGQRRSPGERCHSTLFCHRAFTGAAGNLLPKSAQLNYLRFSGRVCLPSLIQLW